MITLRIKQLNINFHTEVYPIYLKSGKVKTSLVQLCFWTMSRSFFFHITNWYKQNLQNLFKYKLKCNYMLVFYDLKRC